MSHDERIDIRVPADERKQFFDAAKIEGMTMSTWARRVLKREAGKVLAAQPPKKGSR